MYHCLLHVPGNNFSFFSSQSETSGFQARPLDFKSGALTARPHTFTIPEYLFYKVCCDSFPLSQFETDSFLLLHDRRQSREKLLIS